MKCIFIYNPKSGKGKIKKKLPYITKRLSEKYGEIDVYETKCRGDLTAKVKEIANLYDTIVFSGGDGTFNELLQGLSVWEQLPALGYIPTGTTNDIAHSLKIPCKSLRRQLNVVLKGRVEKLDCMMINGEEYAMYCVCAGAFTKATYTTPQQNKKIFGRLAYGIEGLRSNIPFKVFPVTMKNEEETIRSECVFALIMNSKRVAGFRLNAKGSMQDGLLEGAIVKQKKNPNFFYRWHAFFSLIRLFIFGYRFKEKSLAQIDGESFQIEVPDDVVWNYDGEKGRCGNIEIKVLKNRVPLIVPKNNKNI